MTPEEHEKRLFREQARNNLHYILGTKVVDRADCFERSFDDWDNAKTNENKALALQLNVLVYQTYGGRISAQLNKQIVDCYKALNVLPR